MKKLTKVQHKAAIKRFIEKTNDLESLRAVHMVAELFQEEADTCESGSVLITCDTLRILLNLIVADYGSEAHYALNDVWDYEVMGLVDTEERVMLEMDSGVLKMDEEFLRNSTDNEVREIQKICKNVRSRVVACS